MAAISAGHVPGQTNRSEQQQLHTK